MPTYVYEAKEEEKSCERCKNGFEVIQSIKDDRLTQCPHCGNQIYRVLQPVGLCKSKTDLHYRAKRAGFKCLKKTSGGEYEKMY
mgnify:CR=1 FL=1